MAHQLSCSWFFKFQIGANQLKIKFCVGKLSLFSPKIFVWYPERQPSLKIWVKIKKKNDLCDRKAQDEEMVRPNTLHILNPRIRGSSIALVKFWFRPFNLWPRPDLQKIAKSNPIFHLQGWGDAALILRFLDSPVAEFFSWRIVTFFYFDCLQGEMGGQSRTKRTNFG